MIGYSSMPQTLKPTFILKYSGGYHNEWEDAEISNFRYEAPQRHRQPAATIPVDYPQQLLLGNQFASFLCILYAVIKSHSTITTYSISRVVLHETIKHDARCKV